MLHVEDIIDTIYKLKDTRIQYGYITRQQPGLPASIDHRPVSRAVASLAVFSSACRSAKVSADIFKLTSCAGLVGLAFSAGGPDAQAPH